jgi:hypothetical protein
MEGLHMNRESAPFGLKSTLLKLLWLLPGPLFYAFFRLSFMWPSLTESVYSRSIYPVIAQVLSSITGLLPFSLAELLLYAFILSLVVYTVLTIIAAIRLKRKWWQALLNRLIILLSIVSMIYALFVGLWGFNYARLPLSDSLGLDASPATVDELYATCEALIDQANALRAVVPENEDGVFSPDLSKTAIMIRIPGEYNNAAARTGHRFLGGSYGRVKPVLYSQGMSWSHLCGIYFPFTGEANVNADAPNLLFASSCTHEQAHQRGFAREDEANFLAYYVLSYSDNMSMRYSGTMLALIHTMNALYSADSDRYYKLRDTYTSGLSADLQANGAYWQQYESEVSEAVTQVNNTYLKANMQSDGVKSYGRMTDLLIALWRSGGISDIS